MASSLKRGFGRQSDALVWRREVNRQQEVAIKMTKEYEAVEKAGRASEHDNSLSRQETVSLPRQMVNENSEDSPKHTEDVKKQVGESPRPVTEFLVKWVGYDEPPREPTKLSWGGLLYDYLRANRSSQRFQMVQVANED
ncbi:unnamed protein product [Phytophthora fragariaefolia]|uniref:Unnamed protein product n=1 Tax=Phytophthora fragariaefolia TaxID=1490495 RepID=A0A9W6XMV0_9STRA|nr:unnamed protein product [Phytophthora fragariaefolia]